ncbi:MAG: transglutaminase-like domain-containing protein, partial [Candidatus Bathyarchaeota archaeon]|nr:transglutaminase-like domain-containing protein [Candidatus Bathyarchaeota archaeon]
MRLRYVVLLLLLIGTVPVSAYTYEMTWSYENQGTTPYNMSQKDHGVPVFPDTMYQTVTMETSFDGELAELEPGFLKMVPFSTVLVPIDETYTITATYQIESESKPVPSLGKQLAETPEQIPLNLHDYTQPNALYPSDNTEIIEIATRITVGEETVYGQVLKLIDWFEENATYVVTEEPKRPEYTVRDPRGDCDDLSLLFITMCRSRGIPAYLQAGVVLSESIDIDETDWDGHYHYVFDGVGWHAWAMVYIPPWGWLPVDLTMLGGMSSSEAITEAFYWDQYTIVAWNITSHDYIMDETNQREALTESNIVFTQVDKQII